jgi:hypothetical protein
MHSLGCLVEINIIFVSRELESPKLMSTDESRKDETKNSISLTDMRLRKMILDSGTPLLISKEMA